jgi:hypothetical protein
MTPAEEFQEYLSILRASNAAHAIARADRRQREKRREFWRNLVGGLIVLCSPILFFVPFWLFGR